MKRGDIVTVSISGDYGKPRPAIVIQTNALSDTYPSVVVCPMTSTLLDLDFRILLEPDPENGLRHPSQVMTDKIIGVSRMKVGGKIGAVSQKDMLRLGRALVFLLALAETEDF
jgi:mRNA interferase MazF